MQFEKFDDKVKQAAEQHHPNYDEKAWARMEKLLDHHLPLESDRRRRIIFFVLFFLLLGGGATLFMMNNSRQQEKTISSFKNTAPENTNVPPPTGSEKKLAEAVSNNELHQKIGNDQTAAAVNEPGIQNPATSSNGSNKANKSVIALTAPKQKNKPVQKESFQANIDAGNIAKRTKPGNENGNVTTATTTTTTKAGSSPQTDNTLPDNTIPSLSGKVKTAETQPINDIKDKDPLEVVVNDKKAGEKTNLPRKNVPDQTSKATDKSVTTKNKGKNGNTFFLSASAGPDVSSVNNDKLGTVKLLGGVGFGYTFNDRWTIRTGFYTARKIYTADKESYKPSIVIPNYPYLDKINADCKVYEIPLLVSYNFGKSKKGNWFASTGLSSYIMKKEVYDYVYDFPWAPQPSIYSKTINNGSEHYFSMLSVSAGYQRKISRDLSVSAEPYFKTPLAGIGFGNVKLKSAGVLVSLTLSLFQPAQVK